MKWTDLPIVAVDVETTGLHHHEGDRITEIALVRYELDDDMQLVQRDIYDRLVNPQRPIPPESSRISGITDDDVRDAPLFSDIAHEVLERIEGSLLIAHNFSFDHGFVKVELELAGEAWVEPAACVDTLTLFRKIAPKESTHKLANFAATVGVPLEQAHRASPDAEATLRAMIAWAKREHAPSDLNGFLQWAGGVGRPPDEGIIGVNAHGHPIFRTGPHQGQNVLDHVLHLQWYTLARERTAQGTWGWRAPQATRQWIEQYLAFYTMGSSKSASSSYHHSSWGVDSCISAPPRDERGSR